LTHTIEQRPPCTPLVSPGQIDHHVADLTATVCATVTLQALQAHLGEQQQFLAIDGHPQETIGQLVLRNSTGPLRLGYGGWRDVLLGVQFRNGLNELISAGGRVLKNVAGYDLTKLLIGSGGVFGEPVTLTLRTYRRPDAALHVQTLPQPAIVGAIMHTTLRPSWSLLSPDRLLLGYLGDEAFVDFTQAHIAAVDARRVERVDTSVDAVTRQALWPKMTVARAAVPPARVDAFIAESHLTGGWSADPAFGAVIVHAGANADLERLHRAAVAVDGHVTAFDANGRAADLRMDAPAYDVLLRLKRAFDPDGVLPPLPPNREVGA
jgi:hypothetical protein